MMGIGGSVPAKISRDGPQRRIHMLKSPGMSCGRSSSQSPRLIRSSLRTGKGTELGHVPAPGTSAVKNSMRRKIYSCSLGRVFDLAGLESVTWKSYRDRE